MTTTRVTDRFLMTDLELWEADGFESRVVMNLNRRSSCMLGSRITSLLVVMRPHFGGRLHLPCITQWESSAWSETSCISGP